MDIGTLREPAGVAGPSTRGIVVDVDPVSPAGAASAASDWARGEAERRYCAVIAVHRDATSTGRVDSLWDLSMDAQLLVVDAAVAGRGLSSFASTARGAARRRSCPVVVVHGHRWPIRRIAVGIDRSNAADTALDWAIGEADLHAASLTVIHAWQRPTGSDRSMRVDDLCRAEAQCIVDVAVAHVARQTTQPVRGRLVEGNALAALMAQSAHTDLLVIGSRGRSGFKTMLFGSVALAVATGSVCPVVLVHPEPRRPVDRRVSCRTVVGR